MLTYIASDNIYWAFSSSAQAIAAFIGFLSAGFFFSHDRMDRLINKDETLVEILTDIKKQHFRKLRFLLWLTGFSIILSLVVVFINGFDTGVFLTVFAVFVAFLNAYTVLRAVLLVIDMVDPNNVKKTADKLIVEATGEDAVGTGTKAMSTGEFLEKFIELEQLIRKKFDKIPNNSSLRDFERERFEPLTNIIRQFARRQIITHDQLEMLTRVNTMRNLVSHGRIDNVGAREKIEVEELIRLFRNL
jgi:hypothetical protein